MIMNPPEMSLEFTCPKCGGHELDHQQTAVIHTRITRIRSAGIGLYLDVNDQYKLTDDTPCHKVFRCVGCNKDFKTVREVRKHCRSMRKPHPLVRWRSVVAK